MKLECNRGGFRVTQLSTYGNISRTWDAFRQDPPPPSLLPPPVHRRLCAPSVESASHRDSDFRFTENKIDKINFKKFVII